MLSLGSLFDGIGVFPLAATRAGITPVWASEIEKAPVSITKRHFPGMLHLGDITKLDGGMIPPVDIITFGSPCQNLSQAGCREGLGGSKSGLFFEAIRIIEEMRKATNGTYPTICTWENVMGAFSSSNRMDFKAVLESFAATEVPMPPAGRWANAGMVRGGRADTAWRLVDAQHWGRPRLVQRRKRIFLVADYGGRFGAGGRRAGEILFKARPMLPNPEPCHDRGLPAAGRSRISLKKTGGQIPTVHAFQDRRMRGQARLGDQTGFIGSFGKPTDPFPTLLAGTVNMFAYWLGDDYQNGVIRYLTETECERIMGLPEGWTAFGHDGKPISTGPRCKALGNAIALPNAEYIMLGIKEVLG